MLNVVRGQSCLPCIEPVPHLASCRLGTHLLWPFSYQGLRALPPWPLKSWVVDAYLECHVSLGGSIVTGTWAFCKCQWLRVPDWVWLKNPDDQYHMPLETGLFLDMKTNLS